MLPSSVRRREASAEANRLSLLSTEALRRAARFAFAVSFAGLAGAAPLRAQGAPITGSARVTVVASPGSGVVGAPVQVAVRVDLSSVMGRAPLGANVAAVLGAYQVKIQFDKTLLRFDSVTGGTSDGYASPPITTDPSVANASGAVTLAAAQASPNSPGGLVHVATLVFQALDHGAALITPTPLSLSTALQPGPPAVGLAAIPGSGAPLTLPIDVVSGDLVPDQIRVDPNGNGILEPGEDIVAAPSWTNVSAGALSVDGSAAAFSGPAGATYDPVDAGAAYGSIGAGATADCLDATGNCYGLSVSVPGSRPSAHWDAYFTESPTTGDIKTWSLHVGRSFNDVPTSHLFYRMIETIFHNAVTGGCGTGIYCPEQTVTRAQMAVFLLKSRYGATYVPPLPSGTKFTDVSSGAFAAGWIEDLANRGITGGCGNGAYCANSSVTRSSMAVLLLRTEHGSAYMPPAATGMFSDVPVSDPFAKWIEQLAKEGVTGGCGSGKYCPETAVSRGQMAAFLAKTFKLSL